ncbi:hypothetical protein O181_076788 [Austropuccinia psidii MF-1]|uniref:Uncharacterized protein n=1 Tax=Austropuccinia psidii MF-1 TaxID=1389203 RepID=A0A9Q3FFR5_9BASI|nr:hypothetical protein [Austropuccinia psidii MF-1]
MNLRCKLGASLEKHIDSFQKTINRAERASRKVDEIQKKKKNRGRSRSNTYPNKRIEKPGKMFEKIHTTITQLKAAGHGEYIARGYEQTCQQPRVAQTIFVHAVSFFRLTFYM